MKVVALFSRFVLALFVFVLWSCSSTPESKLVGTWKVTDVQIDFDEQKADPTTVNQVAEREKKTILKFTSDSTLSIIDNHNTHRAKWMLDENGVISYNFENDLIMHELGTYQDGAITIKSDTPLGEIVTVFEKSK